MTLDIGDRDGTVEVTHDDVLLARYRAETPASRPHFDTLALPAGPARGPGGTS